MATYICGTTMSLFISHSHSDKGVARRIARRLGARGLATWIDSRELRLGNALEDTIRDAISKASAVVVVASASAAQSSWVRRELAFARTLAEPKPVCPVFVEHVERVPLFADDLGVDATAAHVFEAVLGQLAASFGGSDHLSAEHMRTDLELLAREEPGLSALIGVCLRGEQNPWSDRIEGLGSVDLHDLDFALCSLYDLASDDESCARVARYSSTLFPDRGAGTYVLANHSQRADEFDLNLLSAIGQTLDPSRLDAAIHLLSARSMPDDRALMQFIAKNGSLLDPVQRDAVLRLATHPYRPPAGFAGDAAYEALAIAPESEALRSRFQRWIMQGEFDGLPGHSSEPKDVLNWLGKARERGLQGWEPIQCVLNSHVRALARSCDRRSVSAAVEYLFAAASEAPALLGEFCEECELAIGSAEWKKWTDRDEMACFMLACTEAVRAGRSYAEASADYERTWQMRQKLDELRSKLGPGAVPTAPTKREPL